jgi:hypothetical protein
MSAPRRRRSNIPEFQASRRGRTSRHDRGAVWTPTVSRRRGSVGARPATTSHAGWSAERRGRARPRFAARARRRAAIHEPELVPPHVRLEYSRQQRGDRLVFGRRGGRHEQLALDHFVLVAVVRQAVQLGDRPTLERERHVHREAFLGESWRGRMHDLTASRAGLRHPIIALRTEESRRSSNEAPPRLRSARPPSQGPAERMDAGSDDAALRAPEEPCWSDSSTSATGILGARE